MLHFGAWGRGGAAGRAALGRAGWMEGEALVGLLAPLFLARRIVKAGGGEASRGLRGVGGGAGAPLFLGLRGASGRGRCSFLAAWGRGGGPGKGGASCCPFGGVGGVGAWCPDVRACLGERRPHGRDCTRRVFRASPGGGPASLDGDGGGIVSRALLPFFFFSADHATRADRTGWLSLRMVPLTGERRGAWPFWARQIGAGGWGVPAALSLL